MNESNFREMDSMNIIKKKVSLLCAIWHGIDVLRSLKRWGRLIFSICLIGLGSMSLTLLVHAAVNVDIDGRDVFKYRWPTVLMLLLILGALWHVYAKRRRDGIAHAQVEHAWSCQVILLQAALDRVPHPMLVKAQDGRLLAINSACEALFNLSRAEVMGKIEVDVLPFSDVSRQKLVNTRHAISRLAFDEELSYIDAHGNEKQALFSMSAVFVQPDQVVIGLVGLFIDQSEYQRACVLADAAEQRLHDLTDNLSVVVFQLHLTMAGKLSFIFVSGNVIGLFGISAQVMMEDEQHAMLRVLPEDRKGMEQEFKRSAATLQPARPLFRVNNGKQILWLSGHIVPRREADGSIIWNGYCSDITKERDQASDAAHEAAHATARAKDEFLAMMSHEIRTPMNGVMGLAEVLEDTPLNNDQAGLVKMMRDSAGTMLAILDDILDYSKIEAGHMSLSYTAVDLRQLCDQTLGLLVSKAQEKRLQLRIQVDATVAAKHSADGTRLRQVLFNLLSNAIKFTSHGSIVLGVAVVENSSDQQRLRITVEDTGKGISKEQLSRLFEPFVQEDSSISRRFGGTGLGLSICRRLVTMMNGEIALDSVENLGTTAQLELTLTVIERDYFIPALRGHRVRLLALDYNIRAALQMYLTALGMDVVDSADVELKIGSSTRPGTIELTWAEAQDRPAKVLQLGANPLQWGTLRQACLATVKNDFQDATSIELTLSEPSKQQRVRILVAEDNPTNQEVMRRFLHRLNFDCDVVNNGLEAFEALKKNSYALLLTDCHMPELDGYALVRHIREIEHAHGLARMPVVGITASTRAEDEQIAKNAGMDACLVKPTGLEMLSNCLERLLSQVSAYDEAAQAGDRSVAFGKFELPEAGPISSLQLKHLEKELGEEGKMTVLRVFRDTLKHDLSIMPDDSDAELAGWLHRVKGAIAVMEFNTLLEAINEVCVTLAAGDADPHARASDQFRMLCDKAIGQIDKLLPLDHGK